MSKWWSKWLIANRIKRVSYSMDSNKNQIHNILWIGFTLTPIEEAVSMFLFLIEWILIFSTSYCMHLPSIPNPLYFTHPYISFDFCTQLTWFPKLCNLLGAKYWIMRFPIKFDITKAPDAPVADNYHWVLV